ncbi:MAG: alpha-galactosidase [Acidobacterium ailaaui]|nr:alpha-galactosidase [Pseudacidobacterium ailaaui]
MKKKIQNIPLVLLSIFLITLSCNKSISIDNKDLHIEINNKMQMRINSLFTDASKLMDKFSSSEYLVTKYFIAKEFSLSRIEKKAIHDHAGSGTEWILTGQYKDYPLEKIVYITTYEQFPNTAFFKVKYINKGEKELPVLKWVNNHYDLIPSIKDTTKFWSFQGSSHADRRDWIQPVNPGLYHRNYMGMNASDYGGGIPIVDLWRRDAGIAIGLTDSIFRLISLPVDYGKNAKEANISVQYEYTNNLVLKPDDTLSTFETFVSVHNGDCFSTLRTYAQYMKTKGIKPAKTENSSYEPMWCAWGYGKDFTLKEIINTLPKVKELGIKWVGIDDGFSQDYGDWHANKKKFPNGDAEMKALVDTIHAWGLKAMLWWNPIAVSPNSKFLKENPNVILRDKDGRPEYISWWNAYYIAPTDSIALSAAKNTVKLFIQDWGYDGLKLDGQNLNLCAPDYATGHNISNTNKSFEQLPYFFKVIFATARDINPNACVEFCPCGSVMNFYVMPYTNQFVASDPESSWQVRTKALVYHALMPHIAYYGDHVELINDDFASQIGVGGVPGTKFVWPKVGSAKDSSLLLTPKKERIFKKWISLYNEMMLSKGKYRGDLYDIGYDYPETHCIEKEGVMYYALYNKDYNGKIQLRGLDPSKDYTVVDYYHNKNLGTIKGNNPKLQVNFKGFLMLKVEPKDSI